MRAELRAHLTRWVRELSSMSPVSRAVYTRRVARTAAGVVALVGGALVLAVGALAGADAGIGGPVPTEGRLTRALCATWGAALLVYAFARLFAPLRFDALLRARLAPTGEPFGDLDRARRSSPAELGARLAQRHERASIGAPLAGLSLLLPLTLHYLFVAAIGRAWPSEASFDAWIAFSAVLVGHCHVVVAILAWRFGHRARGWRDEELVGRAARDGWGAWTWALGLSSIPGVCFYSVPMLIVAMTGTFIPVAFSTVAALVRGERGLLTTVMHG